jgi:hypothetical protein
LNGGQANSETGVNGNFDASSAFLAPSALTGYDFHARNDVLSSGQQQPPSQELMKNYFINSDAVSNEKRSYHDEWIERGIAVTSGGREYRDQIDSIPKGSTLVLHEPNSGAVAAGTVLDAGSVIVKRGAGTVSPLESEEYHRKVEWYADLRLCPLPYSEIIRVWGTNPRLAVQPFKTNRNELMDIIHAYAEMADVEQLRTRKPGATTQVNALVQARRGQGKYRDDLLAMWDRRCAVTGCSLAAVLRASHAKPWRMATDQERLDPRNGLPLIATLDVLFDRGLIGFADDGSMVCSDLLAPADRELLGLPASLLKPLSSEQRAYLRHHREAFSL